MFDDFIQQNSKQKYKEVLTKIKSLERYLHGAYTPFTIVLYGKGVNAIKKSNLETFLNQMIEHLKVAYENEGLAFTNSHVLFYKSFISAAIFMTYKHFYSYLHRYDCILDFAKAIKRVNGESRFESIIKEMEEDGVKVYPLVVDSLEKMYSVYEECYSIHTERLLETALYLYLDQNEYSLAYDYFNLRIISLDYLDGIIPDMDFVYEEDYKQNLDDDILEADQLIEMMKHEEIAIDDEEELEKFMLEQYYNSEDDQLDTEEPEDDEEIDGSLYYV